MWNALGISSVLACGRLVATPPPALMFIRHMFMSLSIASPLEVAIRCCSDFWNTGICSRPSYLHTSVVRKNRQY